MASDTKFPTVRKMKWILKYLRRLLYQVVTLVSSKGSRCPWLCKNYHAIIRVYEKTVQTLSEKCSFGRKNCILPAVNHNRATAMATGWYRIFSCGEAVNSSRGRLIFLPIENEQRPKQPKQTVLVPFMWGKFSWKSTLSHYPTYYQHVINVLSKTHSVSTPPTYYQLFYHFNPANYQFPSSHFKINIIWPVPQNPLYTYGSLRSPRL